MGKIIYVTGGARSGKSSFAENHVAESKLKRVYLATSIPFDDEMKLRVEKHKEQRGEKWLTIEAYKNLYEILQDKVNDEKIILLDCLTVMVTNLMIMEKEWDWDTIKKEELHSIEKRIQDEIKGIFDFVEERDLELVIVSNELGMGLVPPYALGRHFRDIAGRTNQIVAERADEAYLVVSGLPMRLK
ncbi:bifunctional adenosylcobinamide kinase/adenosylcobinamide-phosphate guanylyltransferase [uncultured Ilyobacter sp.]|uniref:bifunctional adenosylcobinamide kinase/adenosylcobinamide-phosphate guanylyltransferase n=1 Tax=uncultured Ilyobacter sp. TaxID=544433 RepID=UPI0029C7EC9B|nr:bifunctional adenosylcobinamide kinase/adenosylcobinamide-phosphate guanylyltransferase [uncultured Ilyobacter sp.]